MISPEDEWKLGLKQRELNELKEKMRDIEFFNIGGDVNSRKNKAKARLYKKLIDIQLKEIEKLNGFSDIKPMMF